TWFDHVTLSPIGAMMHIPSDRGGKTDTFCAGTQPRIEKGDAMAKFFGNLNLVLLVGVLIAIGVMTAFAPAVPFDANQVFRWFHVFFGILWIGLLYYFNFVQTPVMPSIPAEQTGAINKHIAPSALFYFRYAALFTVLTGLVVAHLSGYLFSPG